MFKTLLAFHEEEDKTTLRFGFRENIVLARASELRRFNLSRTILYLNKA